METFRKLFPRGPLHVLQPDLVLALRLHATLLPGSLGKTRPSKTGIRVASPRAPAAFLLDRNPSLYPGQADSPKLGFPQLFPQRETRLCQKGFRALPPMPLQGKPNPARPLLTPQFRLPAPRRLLRGKPDGKLELRARNPVDAGFRVRPARKPLQAPLPCRLVPHPRL